MPFAGNPRRYVGWLTEAGFDRVRCHDWTSAVNRTWEICRDRVRRSGMRWLAKSIDRKSVLFLDRFDTILEAYRSGAMRYGAFVFEKPIGNDKQCEGSGSAAEAEAAAAPR